MNLNPQYLSKTEFNNDWRGVVIYPTQPQDLLQLIETILAYKLPRLSRQEIEAMFSLDELKQTRYFQSNSDEHLD